VGINNNDLALMIGLRSQGYIANGASIVEIGAQQLSGDILRSPESLVAIARAFEVEPRSFGSAKPALTGQSGEETLDPNAPFARDFWEWLGFSYAAIDIDGSPGSIPLDLNFDSTPPNMFGKFNVVTNCGTTEHIANQLNAFKVIHELCALGGVMIHNLPAQGMMNHGLINYNPKFFWMLARSNGYKWLHADLLMSTVPHPLPADVVGEMQKFSSEFTQRAEDYRLYSGGLLVALQKEVDIPYVPPIDVPTGAAVDNPELKKRYWTVFDESRFHRMIVENTSKQKRARSWARRLLSRIR
jgi:hypothetical protein